MPRNEGEEIELDEVDHHSEVGDALSLLIDGLAPFVERTLAETLPAGLRWTEVLRQKDATAGKRGGVYSERDLSLLLRVMTERLGELGYPFSRAMSRQGQNYASELRQIRNQWAHNDHFSPASAFRALDSAELLLREIGAESQANEIARSKRELLPPPVAPPRDDDATGERSKRNAKTAEPSTTTDDGRPGITVSALPVLSYAMAHCRVPVIDEVSVAHVGADERGATLEIDVVCAAGSLGGPKVLHLDLIDGETTTLRTIDLVLDPSRMLEVADQQPGQIVVTLRDAVGSALASDSSDVQVLAASQWMAEPVHLAMEMLAAHVQPNSAAIASLLVEASDKLRALTGNSSLNGYQSENPDRVDAIVQSVYEAMAARDIRYSEPPASWGDTGQKVRNPHEVLVGQLGTCLDTTVTLAAALEQAGINSTLWLLKGHIFLGYWRTESSLAAVTSVEIDEVVNLVDLGQVQLVETTMLTGGDESSSFGDATRAPRRRLGGDLRDVLGITDIRQARQARIFPLPSRSTGVDGQVVVSVYEAGARPSIAPSAGTASSDRATGEREAEPARISRWKNALLDLSLRNRLINYTDRSGHHLEAPGQALYRLEDQVNASTTITLIASDAVSSIDSARGTRFGRDLPERDLEVMLADKRAVFVDITSPSYKTKLRYLAYKAKTIVEETGSNNLYLAFGMLRWRFADRDLRSPLMLVPVTLSTTSRGETYRLTIDESGAPTPNYCLLEKLRVSFGLQVPELEKLTEDGSAIGLAAAFEAVREAVVGAGLPFRVEETADLAILQFAKFPLWKDLDEHWQTLSTNKLVHHLIHSPLEPYVDSIEASPAVDLDALGTLVPVPADSSQLEAVHDAVEGATFVLEGPPGTGKSQTITNLLAHALASGRRVLFVAEKRAALDVVKKRLADVGLADLSLDLHDKGARPVTVRSQLRAALDLHVRADADAMNSDTEIVDASRRRLGLYADRLHETNGVGHSLYSAHAFDLASDHSVPAMAVPRAFVTSGDPSRVDEIRKALRRVPEFADLARPRPQHPWRFVDSHARPVDVESLSAVARQVDEALAPFEHADASVPDLLRHVASAAEIKTWAQLASAPRHQIESLDALRSTEWHNHLESLRGELEGLAADSSPWRSAVAADVMDRDVPAIHQAALEADSAGFLSRKKRRRAVVAGFVDLLRVPLNTVDLKSLSTLTASMMVTYDRVSAIRAAVRQVPVPLVPASWNPAVHEQSVHARDAISWLMWTIEALTAAGAPWPDQLRTYYATSPRGSLETELLGLSSAWSALDSTRAVDEQRARVWAGTSGFLPTWWETREERNAMAPQGLQKWFDLIHSVEPLRSHGLIAARDALLDGALPPDDAVIAFDRGLALASLEERTDATALGSFDIAAHNRTIDRFTNASRAVRNELPRALPQAIIDARRFNLGVATGQMGGLRRQLDRQRGGMSVRSMLDNFGELITQIMPCTLMSPESVARFFPARADLFDIVVFDEASQIRVADAVGAMGRARSVVVVGDSKQMPPTQFAEAGMSADDDEYLPENVADEESILTECVQARVPSKWLSWHYRSQDESLIAFSNRQYYENRLSSFPAPLPQDTRDHPDGYGISLIRVNGTFERAGRGRTLRTNRVEADAIVDDVRQRFSISPDVVPSLGVITFNAQQRDLIENLLRDCGDDRIVHALDVPDGLFVKNLENVQGDERDCILFSVAFSTNDKGVLPLNFGPLSKPGGERRLNVAVTRARRQVVMYASFDPGQLRAEQTTQIGTKHLKAYLELAERGVDAVQDSTQRQSFVDRHRDDIADDLERAGFAVRTDVGLSDFRVDIAVADASRPDQPLLAILLDGPNWRARRTVADRDGLPVDVLKLMMRWPGVERVWLPEWMQDRSGTLDRLQQAVDDARTAHDRGPDVALPESATPTSPRLVDAEPIEEPMLLRAQSTPPGRPARARHPSIVDYAEWTPGLLGDRSLLDDLPLQRAAVIVARAAQAAIEAEGPIQPDRLAKRVAGAFNLSRVNDERKRAILRVVPAEHKPADGDGFYWPRGTDPKEWFCARVPEPGAVRLLEEISLNEIANAMRIAAEESGGMTDEEIKLAALNMFGGRRRTDAVKARLTFALTHSLKNGRLERGPDGVLRSPRR